MISELMFTTKLECIMASPVITVSEGDDFHVVQDKFAVHDIRHLPVVDNSGRIVGLISQRDLYKIHSPRRLENGEWYYDKDMLDSFILKNVMVKEPYVLTPNNSVKEAMEVMRDFKFGCIPIVDDEHKPVGIVTRETIMNFFWGWPKRERVL